MRKSIKTGYLIAALCVAIAFLVAVLALAKSEENHYADIQLSAAKRMAEAEEYLKSKIQEKGIEVQANDLNKTYLIGPDYTELTTTLGNLEAKRTSLDPNFAAAMVRYYQQAGLKKGDIVAIGSSGSFPALAMATVIAAKEYGLKTKVIASLGASTYGATRVEFNIFDFLICLRDAGYADFELLAVSRGGEHDYGEGAMEGLLFEGSKELTYNICQTVANETGAEYLVYDSLVDNVSRRLELYGDIDMFVNVGGAAANSGAGMTGHSFPYGLVLERQILPNVEVKGLCYEYSAKGIPVLNLLNVKQLAAENGITFDPVPLSNPGDSGVYSETRYSLVLIILGIVSTTAILVVGAVLSRKKR